MIEPAEEEPPCPGPDETLVRLSLRPINPADRLYVQGRYGPRPTLPAVADTEGMGQVIGIGAPRRVVTIGTRGTWREVIAVPTDRLIAIPDAVSDEAAAQFVAGPLAAWVLVAETTRDGGPGWLVQSAAGSSFAALIREIAGLKGWRTIDLVRRAEQAARLTALGVPHAFSTEDERLGKTIADLTDGRGADAALDAVGGPTGTLLARALGPGSVLVVHGVLDGRPIELHPGWLIAKGATVKGFWLDHWLKTAPENERRATLDLVLGHMAAGRLRTPVDAVFDLAEFRAALARSAEPGRTGKVLLSG